MYQQLAKCIAAFPRLTLQRESDGTRQVIEIGETDTVDMPGDGYSAKFACYPAEWPQFFELTSLVDLTKPCEPWAPGRDEEYWCLDGAALPYRTHNDGSPIDVRMVKNGNCYPTKQVAESHIPAVIAAYRDKATDLTLTLWDMRDEIALIGYVGTYRGMNDKEIANDIITKIIELWGKQ